MIWAAVLGGIIGGLVTAGLMMFFVGINPVFNTLERCHELHLGPYCVTWQCVKPKDHAAYGSPDHIYEPDLWHNANHDYLWNVSPPSRTP